MGLACRQAILAVSEEGQDGVRLFPPPHAPPLFAHKILFYFNKNKVF